MRGEQHATTGTHDRPLPFWRARRGLDEHCDAVFDRVTHELFERDEEGWRRTAVWPSLRVRHRRSGRARWRPGELQVELHWPPRLEDDEDKAADQGAFDVVDSRFTLGARAIAAWTQHVPPNVRQLIAPFPELHGSLLRWAAGGPACVDLLAANPALAVLASECRVLGGPRRARDTGVLQADVERGATQRDLLARLDLPASESVRRLLRKVRPEYLSFDVLCRLAHLVRDERISVRLRHLPEVTPAVARIAASASLLPLVSDGLLRTLVGDERRRRGRGDPRPGDEADGTAGRLVALAWMRRELGDEAPRVVDSPRGLQRTLLAMCVQLRRRNQPEERRPLPPPPYPGTASVVPLTTVDDLVEEGLRMRHCAGSMAGVVANGEVFVYRVLEPERATLAIEKGEVGWRIRDVRGRWNREVAASTWNALAEWLAVGEGR